MVTTRLMAVILCASIWAKPYGQLYTHERVARMPFIGGFLALSEAGDYAYAAGFGGVRDPIDLYVNGVNYSEHMFPEPRRYAGTPFFRADGAILWQVGWQDGDQWYSHLFVNRHNYTAEKYGSSVGVSGFFQFNSRGDIAVEMHPAGSRQYDLWVGDRNVSGPVIPPGDLRFVRGVALTEDGKLFWRARGRFGDHYYDDWYYEDTNLSRDLLGAIRGIDDGDLLVNRFGQYAWSGRGDLTGQRMNVFLGQQNVSAGVLGPGQHDAYLIGIDDSGAVVWYGRRTGDVRDVYRNSENLSEFLGPTRLDSYSQPKMISPSGNVLWVGGSDMFGAGNEDLFLERTNLTHDLLGEQRWAGPIGFAGEVPVWIGGGTRDHGLFIGSHNLTREAGVDPMTLYARESIVANSRGDVLWLTKTTAGFDLWLSRPVPEPSVGAALTLIVVVGIVRRGFALSKR